MNLSTLHSIGTIELEEVIEGYSVGSREFVPLVDEFAYYFIGFARKSKQLEAAFLITDDVDIVTAGAIVPPVERIINDFCRYCYSTRK